MNKITLKDVAKIAGVSYATISRALSGAPEISEATRIRVINICKEMGYSGKSMRRLQSMSEAKTIGLIVNNIHSSYTSEIAYFIETHAWKNGYTLMLCNSAGNLEKEVEVYELLASRQVSGIIVKPSHISSYERLSPFLNRVPTVIINENLKDLPESYVTIDDYKGAYIGTEYLYSLGHRKTIYLGKRIYKVTHRLRAQGYDDACRNLGMSPRSIDYSFNMNSIQNGNTLARELFRKPLDFTAIFASTDMIALGVLQAADEAGINIPGDVSLLGFDNISLASLPRINLTTINQPIKDIAAVAVDMLLEKMKYSTLGYSHRIMMPSLVIRQTCREIDKATISVAK